MKCDPLVLLADVVYLLLIGQYQEYGGNVNANKVTINQTKHIVRGEKTFCILSKLQHYPNGRETMLVP